MTPTPAHRLIGRRFYCKLDKDLLAALMEVVHPYLRDPAKRSLLCCRVVEGQIRDDDGQVNGPKSLCDLPVDRVVAAIERYVAKPEPLSADMKKRGYK